MVPSQPSATNVAPPAKRKPAEPIDLLSKATKKTRNEGPNAFSRAREEKHGGLMIVRQPSVRPPSSQDVERPAASNHASSSRSVVSEQDKSFGGSSSNNRSQTATRSRRRGKEVQDDAPEGEGTVEEDVRQMDTEADDLRDRSRARQATLTPAALRVNFQFPAPSQQSSQSSSSSSRSRSRDGQSQLGVGTPSRLVSKDSLLPITEQETPQIAKNKQMRGEHPSMRQSPGPPANGTNGLARRRSSLSLRGKRISATFETGIITRPHNSVADTSLYKHIDVDLPESQRVRQLLIWTASRAMDQSSKQSTSKPRKPPSTKPPDPDLTPLPADAAALLKEIQEEIIRQLAEKKIDTNVYSPIDDHVNRYNLKENEQNVKNRAREKLFTEQIEERRKEDIAWAEVAQFYVAHKDNVLASTAHRRRARTPLSSNAKGKQRATSQEPEDEEPWENELPASFRGPAGFDVARRLLATESQGLGRSDDRFKDVQIKETSLYTAVSAAHQFAETASSDLDQRFSLLSISLAQRSLPPPTTASTSNSSAVSAFIPVTSLPSARQPGPDPQDLLRAISRTDAERPRRQVGDAARRAAKDVQRLNGSQAQLGDNLGASERRLTDVPPPTPRKPPGTPKRASTPATSKRN